MTRSRTPLGMRRRVALAFGVVALLVSTVMATSTYLLSRGYLLSQRAETVSHQAFADAGFVSRRLETAGADVSAILTAAGTSAGSAIVVRWRGRWYSSSLAIGRDTLPGALRQEVESGRSASQRIRVGGAPMLVIGTHLGSVDAQFYELAPLTELDSTLRLLSTVLISGALFAAVAGTILGVWASGSVVRPLHRVAGAAAEIAGGRLDTRLAATRDPELATIVGSFNSMVDTLQQRIVRDARLAADASHELRSPLTTLVASVDIMQSRRDDLPASSRQALDLVSAELDRFRRLLDNLLDLARSDAGLDPGRRESFAIGEMLRHTLDATGCGPELLSGEDAQVSGDKLRLDRMFRNLIENGQRHGGGISGIEVVTEDDQVLVLVDDRGPGVPHADRNRIFERFATGPAARRSSTGTGLGLALVAETASAHGGSVWCTDRPGGGARFIVSLPRETP